MYARYYLVRKLVGGRKLQTTRRLMTVTVSVSQIDHNSSKSEIPFLHLSLVLRVFLKGLFLDCYCFTQSVSYPITLSYWPIIVMPTTL